MGKGVWMSQSVPFFHVWLLPFPSETSLQLGCCLFPTVSCCESCFSAPWAALLLGCLGGQLYLHTHKLLSNSYLCVPVHREDASFEEDDDLSEEDEEELPPIMPAKK